MCYQSITITNIYCNKQAKELIEEREKNNSMASTDQYLSDDIAIKKGVKHNEGLCFFECVKHSLVLDTSQDAVAAAKR
jgi:hypothetical protein